MKPFQVLFCSFGNEINEQCFLVKKEKMHEENEIKEKILLKTDEKFQQFGFAKVTMEEIAADLGISKKTLYKYFPNKEHILKEILDKSKCEFELFVENLFNDTSLEFIEKLKTLVDHISKNSHRFHGPLVQDLMKNHPQLWHEIQDFRKKKAYNNLSMMLNAGVKEGIFRDDINTEIITSVYMGAIHSLISPEIISELPISFENLHKTVTKIVLEGVLSEEGRNKYKTKDVFNENNGDKVV